MPLALPVRDVRGVGARQRRGEARRLLEVLSSRPFDLERDPLLRAELVRSADDAHSLNVCVHHIVFDAWSARIFVRELDALYRAFVTSTASPLPELALQYGDFARWQRRWLDGEEGRRQLEYWRSRLGDAPRALELPADRPRTPSQRFRGAVHRFELGRDVTSALRDVASAEGTTLFTALLATFQALLGRYAKTDDVCVGVAVVNRRFAALEPLIGYFVNTVVMRTSLAGKPSFGELLRRAHATAVEAFANQDVPFQRVVEELAASGDASRAPLVQAILSLDNTSSRLGEPAGFELETPPLDQGTSRIDLTVALRERRDRLEGYVEYDSDLFAAATVAGLVEDWRATIASATAPGRRAV
jgi:hypothetical protein